MCTIIYVANVEVAVRLFKQSLFISPGPPSTPILSCDDLSGDVGRAVNVTVSWRLSGGDIADFYLINITTNTPQTPYGRLLNITIASVTQHKLTGFIVDYEYSITIRGVNCGSLKGSESEPLIITPQGKQGLALFTVLSMLEGQSKLDAMNKTQNESNLDLVVHPNSAIDGKNVQYHFMCMSQ